LASPADRARIEAASFERHLVKPVEFRRLLETLAELSGDGASTGPRSRHGWR
jgi:hypothetical protein